MRRQNDKFFYVIDGRNNRTCAPYMCIQSNNVLYCNQQQKNKKTRNNREIFLLSAQRRQRRRRPTAYTVWRKCYFCAWMYFSNSSHATTKETHKHTKHSLHTDEHLNMGQLASIILLLVLSVYYNNIKSRSHNSLHTTYTLIVAQIHTPNRIFPCVCIFID